jgi:predicted nucleotide-binding protein
LQDELSDVGFALVLLTPDDLGRSKQQEGEGLKARARQNVVFEYGWMVGALGPERVCAIVKGEIEFPSDIRGITYKTVPASQDLTQLGIEIASELKVAGYEIDANLLLPE